MPKVSFLNEVVTVNVAAGTSVYEAAEKAGVNLGAGRVWVTELTPGAVNGRTFKERMWPFLRAGVRLADQARVTGDVEVRTQPGALETKPNMKWDPDPRPSRWLDRTTGKDSGAKDATSKDS